MGKVFKIMRWRGEEEVKELWGRDLRFMTGGEAREKGVMFMGGGEVGGR